MVGKNYQRHRNQAIKFIKEYQSLKVGITDGGIENSLNYDLKNLKQNKYTLVISGKVNSGKSTFINALLGEEILPTGEVPTTGGIIEIFKEPIKSLNVKFGDGSTSNYSINSASDINDKLNSLARISDEFKDIPYAKIDSILLSNYDPAQKSTKVNIKEILGILRTKKIDLRGDKKKKRKIKKYINDRKLSEIPVEINVGYPLDWDFKSMRIVDTPGVDDASGHGQVSYEYLKTANAILFIQNPQDTIQNSFKKFVERYGTLHDKNSLFLVLSKGFVTGSKKLLEQAIEHFSDHIAQKRILMVDSICELILKDLQKGYSQDEVENKYGADHEALIGKAFMKAQKNGDDYFKIMRKGSGFKTLRSSLNKFSAKAPENQLLKILNKISRGCDNVSKSLEETSKLNQSKLEDDPIQFRKKINALNSQINDFKKKLGETNEELNGKFDSKNDTDWVKDLENVYHSYSDVITRSDDTEKIKEQFLKCYNELSEFKKNLTDEILNAAADEQINLRKNFTKISYLVPEFDYESIKKDAELKAHENSGKQKRDPDNIIEWVQTIFGKEFYNYVDFEENLLDTLKGKLSTELINYKDMIHKECGNLVDDIIKRIGNLYNREINDKKKKLINLESEKKTDKQIRKEMEKLNDKLLHCRELSDNVKKCKTRIAPWK